MKLAVGRFWPMKLAGARDKSAPTFSVQKMIWGGSCDDTVSVAPMNTRGVGLYFHQERTCVEESRGLT